MVGTVEAEDPAAERGLFGLLPPHAESDESEDRKAGHQPFPGMNRNVGGVANLGRKRQHEIDESSRVDLRFHGDLLPFMRRRDPNEMATSSRPSSSGGGSFWEQIPASGR